VSVDLRSAPIKLVIGFGVVLALSACSSSSSPGVLTPADIPSYLGVRANPSAFAAEDRKEAAPPYCSKAGFVPFTVPGKPLDTQIPAAYPAIVSTNLVCANTYDAHKLYRSTITLNRGRSIVGIGNEATLINFDTKAERYYEVFWRDNNLIGEVTVIGPHGSNRITPALAELLARRAAARS